MSKPSAIPFSTTLHVRDHCLCLHANQAARALARRFDAAFRPLGLSSGQFSLLMSLNRPEPPKLAAVADLLAMDRTTLIAALKPLERRDLATSIRAPSGRSERLLALTDAGRALLAEAVPIWERMHAEQEARLQADPDPLRAGLRALS